MTRRPRSRFVARGNGAAYTPRHWNGQIAPTPYEAPRGGGVPAVAAFICAGLLLALTLAGIAVGMVLSWPVR